MGGYIPRIMKFVEGGILEIQGLTLVSILLLEILILLLTFGKYDIYLWSLMTTCITKVVHSRLGGLLEGPTSRDVTFKFKFITTARDIACHTMGTFVLKMGAFLKFCHPPKAYPIR